MKNLDFLKENIIAHRGLHNINLGIPENSLLAFQKAIDNNYTIELDIHILKDNTVVVFHDDNLNRMTGIDKKIKNTTYNELSKLNLQNTSEKIPTLSQVLSLIDSKVPIIIEFKTDAKLGLLEKEAMKILANYKGPFAIKSFSPICIYYFKKHYPNIIRGQLSYNYDDSKFGFIVNNLLKNMAFNFITKPDFISYKASDISNKKLIKLKQKYIVLGWTIKSKEQYVKYKNKFDNLICENMQNYF